MSPLPFQGLGGFKLMPPSMPPSFTAPTPTAPTPAAQPATQGAAPPVGVPGGSVNDIPPTPGVSGVTPGAIERRMTLPATAQASGLQLPPSAAAPQHLMSQEAQGGPTLGPTPAMVQSPMAAIQALVQSRAGERMNARR